MKSAKEVAAEMVGGVDIYRTCTGERRAQFVVATDGGSGVTIDCDADEALNKHGDMVVVLEELVTREREALVAMLREALEFFEPTDDSKRTCERSPEIQAMALRIRDVLEET